MVVVENISKSFGPQILFEKATFSIDPWARIGVVGPNGAGKSTFFRMLASLEPPDGGEIRLPKNFRVGLMLQEWNPQPNDTVLGAALRGHADWFLAKERLEKLAKEMESSPTDARLASYHAAETEFNALGGYHLDRHAKELLSGLGFKPSEFDSPAKQLSGGWRIRCHLAGLLLAEPDLLLLDEPTNHLDVETVVWFENFLSNYPHAVMLISHDRRLLERTSRDILEFAPPKLTLWPGTLREYQEQKIIRMEQLEAEIANKEKEIARMKEFVDRFRAKATKARQAQNRLKSAEHYEEEVARLRNEMPVIAKRASRFRLQLPTRLPRKVLEIEHGKFGYTKDRPLFELERAIIEGGKKIGIIGVNGVGKSTFLKCCAGELPLLSGKLNRSESVSLGYFAQHRMEQLPTGFMALEFLYGGASGISMEQVRAVAGSLGLGANDMEKPLSVLSGGEKARVSLTQILLRRPGLLLLDEPTNHLDLEACDALVRGLADYEGTVMVVSHDRDFLDSLVEYILEITPGRALLHHGNYSEWFERFTKKSGIPVQTKPKEKKNDGNESRKQRSAETRKEKKKLGEMEADLENCRTQLKALDEKLCLPQSPKDPQFATWLKERRDLADRIERLEARWLAAAEKLES